MASYYEVHYRNKVAGKVELLPQGLYCRVICRCNPPDQAICRLFAVTETGRENLGVVVPEEDGFILDRKIPAKKLSGNGLRFVLSAEGAKMEGKLIPVCPEEPFAYIDKLNNAFLETQNGQVCIRIEETPETV